MKHYIGIVHHDADSDSAWGITFPDLPGCVSAADNFEDLLDAAAEAVSLWLEVAEEEPEASSFDAVTAHEDAEGAISYLPVPVIDDGPAQRINITVPERLLNRIDRAAESAGTTRSGWIQTMASRAVQDRHNFPWHQKRLESAK